MSSQIVHYLSVIILSDNYHLVFPVFNPAHYEWAPNSKSSLVGSVKEINKGSDANCRTPDIRSNSQGSVTNFPITICMYVMCVCVAMGWLERTFLLLFKTNYSDVLGPLEYIY